MHIRRGQAGAAVCLKGAEFKENDRQYPLIYKRPKRNQKQSYDTICLPIESFLRCIMRKCLVSVRVLGRSPQVSRLEDWRALDDDLVLYAENQRGVLILVGY